MQFAGVEQQLKSNDELAQLVTLQQTTQATQALSYVGNTAPVDGSPRRMTKTSATWHLNVPTKTRHRQHYRRQFQRPDVVTPANTPPTPAPTFPSHGTAWAMTARNGPTASTRSRQRARTTTGNNVGIATQVQGVVSSVDLTQSPPLLTINGTSYTLSQVKSIIATSSN